MNVETANIKMDGEILMDKIYETGYYNDRKEKVSGILQIGFNEELSNSLSRQSVNPVCVTDFTAAKLNLLNTSVFLEAIFIDLPLNLTQLENFCVFLKKNKKLSKIPVFYHRIQLDWKQEGFLKYFGLIDEAIGNDVNNIRKLILNKNVEKNRQEWLQFRNIKRNLNSEQRWREFALALKKAFDITIAALIILFLLPVFILIALAIRIESKGPVFYSSPRAGRGYKIFKFYKFRSMVVDADKKIADLAHLNQYDANSKGPNFFKLSNDPRVTKVGRILRNTSLDELPQLFNVLKGDMSLVGNRPLPLYEAETLTSNHFLERFAAPAGMTGLWQVKKRGKADMSIEERVDLDIIYARKASPIFDLYLLLITPKALFQKSDV